MSKYFRYFPEVVYTGKVVRDITKRVRFHDTVGSNPYVFLPYTIKEGEKPEDVSHLYYGSVDYVWLIYLANNIIDPFYDWPMTQDNLEKCIMDKYASNADAVGQAVLDWSRATNTVDNVLHYQNIDGVKISKETYTLGSTLTDNFTAVEWSPVRVYDYEFDRNEDRRNIQIVDRQYKDQMDRELKEVLNT